MQETENNNTFLQHNSDNTSNLDLHNEQAYLNLFKRTFQKIIQSFYLSPKTL